PPPTEPPQGQFGRTMRTTGELREEWYRLVWEREPPEGDSMAAKLALARFVVERSHGDEAARRAEEHFTRVVREGRAPGDVPELRLPAGEPLHLPAGPGHVVAVPST